MGRGVLYPTVPVLYLQGGRDVGRGEGQFGNLGAGSPVDYLALHRGLLQAHQVHLDPEVLQQ